MQSQWRLLKEIPDSAWILVEVEGRIGYARNPLCYALAGYCDGPMSWLETDGPFGPLQFGAQVRVTTRRPGQPDPTSAEGVGLYSPTDDDRSSVGRWLYHNTLGPQSVWGRHDLLQTHAGNPTNPNVGYWGVYMIGGTQSFTVKVVPRPLRLTGPVSIEKGDSAIWTAEPVGDFRLRDSRGRTLVTWQFFPNDTLPEHNVFGPRVTLSCDQLACSYGPQRSGRLVASTYAEGRFVSAASQVVRIDTARLELRCDRTRVERAQSINCSIAARPSGTLTDIRWQFVDSASNVIAGPTTQSWGGTMVAGGRISVRANLNGREMSADTPIAVSPRQWTSPVPRRREIYQRCQVLTPVCFLLYPPAHENHLGVHIFQPRGVRLLDRAATITAGPNSGWSYLSGTNSPSSFDEHVIIQNDVLNPANNDDVATAFWAERPQCTRDEVRTEILNHERHHADLYDRNRHLIDADVERTIAFVPEHVWRQMLGRDGSEAARIARMVHEIAGGLHTAADAFPYDPSLCDFELPSN